MEKKKKKMGFLEWAFIIAVVIGFVCLFSDNSSSNTGSGNVTNTVKHYDNLNDAYNDHKNYIWNVCKEGLKMISSAEEHNFDGPTYAGEYQGIFIMKGTDNGVLFRCEFIPAENEWGMNLDDVKREY